MDGGHNDCCPVTMALSDSKVCQVLDIFHEHQEHPLNRSLI